METIELKPDSHQAYDERFMRCLQDIGMNDAGAPLRENWTLNAPLLRSWLRKLRQACTHPSVGLLDVAKGTTGGVRSIGEVLENMVETNRKTVLDDRRLHVCHSSLSLGVQR